MTIFEKLPQKICLTDKEYGINTDFRTWVKIEQLLYNANKDFSKIAEALLACYKELPSDPEEAIRGMMWFYSCGKNGVQQERGKSYKKMPVYNFEDDAEYIYAAFLSEFGIDLCAADLHWWKFRALFLALSENSKFAKMVAYRSMDLSKIKDKEQKRYYETMKKLYRLPDRRTDEEKERAITESFEAFF